MQESVSMHKSPIPLRHSRMNQARSEEEEKERKRDRKDRGQEADGKKGSPTKQNTSEELRQRLPSKTRVNKAGVGTLNFLLATCDPLPPACPKIHWFIFVKVFSKFCPNGVFTQSELATINKLV